MERDRLDRQRDQDREMEKMRQEHELRKLEMMRDNPELMQATNA